MPAIGRQGVPERGTISWFGGPQDRSAGPTTASGASVNVPAISTYNHNTLGGWWLVRMPNGHQAVLKQTDIGPAPWTGRNFDFTYTSLPKLGYSTGNFPTNAAITATYLGKQLPGQYAHLNITGGGNSAASGPGQPQRGGAPGLQGPLTNVVNGGSLNLPITSFNQQAYQKDNHKFILGQFLKNQGGSPWDQGSPKVPGLQVSNPLLQFLPQTAPNPSDYETTQTLKVAQSALQQIAGPSRQLNVHPGALKGYRGYVNPIPGFGVGRTDMGVDASSHPGAPIRAIGDSRVIGFSPNWYAGQPYMLLQLLNGPKAGKFYYVAEQISPRVHSGQVVHAGDVIATYANSGSAIEIGWGSGTPGRTLAQATTGYHEGQVTPAGSDFRQFLAHLGAR